ncbi:uncharacterized protein J3D65DRAFT_364775 [Phyllosticta citribraziliensis]|uniref:Uncharacterized protein n=1 Tax=Phyllosticta citribraziliensis TaxID=989973 RepID=A0ABR1LPG3_9PEZI
MTAHCPLASCLGSVPLADGISFAPALLPSSPPPASAPSSHGVPRQTTTDSGSPSVNPHAHATTHPCIFTARSSLTSSCRPLGNLNQPPHADLSLLPHLLLPQTLHSTPHFSQPIPSFPSSYMHRSLIHCMHSFILPAPQSWPLVWPKEATENALTHAAMKTRRRGKKQSVRSVVRSFVRSFVRACPPPHPPLLLPRRPSHRFRASPHPTHDTHFPSFSLLVSSRQPARRAARLR